MPDDNDFNADLGMTHGEAKKVANTLTSTLTLAIAELLIEKKIPLAAVMAGVADLLATMLDTIPIKDGDPLLLALAARRDMRIQADRATAESAGHAKH